MFETLVAASYAVRRRFRRSLPQRGYPAGQNSGVLEALSDADLEVLNRLLPWHAFIADGRGRRFGDAAWYGKRNEPQQIPDRRIAMLNERFNLAKRSVLEVGCFEGVHTVALCHAAKEVIAIDARVENVAKTLLRTAMLDCWPKVYVQDIEDVPTNAERLGADVGHHVGVLYHLRDPVSHLLDLGRYVRVGLMLDTHVARPDEVDASYEAAGRKWRYRRYFEGGRADPFSGMHEHAKWLPWEELEALLSLAGFPIVEVAERREERNGLRLLVFARRAEA